MAEHDPAPVHKPWLLALALVAVYTALAAAALHAFPPSLGAAHAARSHHTR